MVGEEAGGMGLNPLLPLKSSAKGLDRALAPSWTAGSQPANGAVGACPAPRRLWRNKDAGWKPAVQWKVRAEEGIRGGIVR